MSYTLGEFVELLAYFCYQEIYFFMMRIVLNALTLGKLCCCYKEQLFMLVNNMKLTGTSVGVDIDDTATLKKIMQ